MTTLSITQLCSILSEKAGREAAESLTVYVEDKIKDEIKHQSDVLATKLDIADTKQDLLNVELRLTERIRDTRADVIKWMFIFWVGQVAATFGFILLFLKK